MRENIEAQAYINEYKGNLFEFLVAGKLSRHFGIEAQFLSDLLPLYKEKLVEYEKALKKIDPDLFRALPLIAEECFKGLVPSLNFKPKQIFLVGKVAKSSATELDDNDLLLLNEMNEVMGLSLKLGKEGSFINTKSAGVRSFLKNYFEKGESFQEELNQKLTLYYQSFANALYAEHDLGAFDDFKAWRKAGLSELPGELMGPDREVLLQYYNECIKCFYVYLKQLALSSPREFKQSILRLLGFTEKRMLQVMTYHQGHEFKGMNIRSHEEFSALDFEFKEKSLEEIGTSALHLQNSKLNLQLRMKPMNVFTTPSMKVNCSVKYLES